MNSSKLIMGCLAALGLSAGAATVQADVDRDAIAERLKPVGELCLQGEDCGTQAAQADASGSGEGEGNGGDIDGANIYSSVCAACHDTGAAGAPTRGSEDAWAERVEKGFATLLDHSLNGFNAMPARGGNSSLSDAEVEAATAYLVEPVMDVPEAGGDAASSDEEDATSDEEDAAADEGQAAAGEEDAATDEEEAASSEEDAAADDEEAASEEGDGGDAPSHAGIDGEAIYNQVCMACHETGAANAPVRGNADQWAGRLEKGIDTLYDHSINGFNAMPAKGGNASLSDDEVKAATDYLVEPVQ
ncbi:c-type cytochrome [Billgrantia gudaonensis]|uniref:Cytochrome c5 n=1 Tax=Billgrantia gudaonensis TaxID=376427 RepID=A0A1G8Y9C4_9GAMM|nr:c-type cytochrome [Halomonas gudaonensis]SDJ99489.1 Cytochrome c5 [Halomonas gudaonensis]